MLHYNFTIRARYPNTVGMLAKITSAISKAGGDIGALDIIDICKGLITRDISVAARDKDHSQNIVSRAAQIRGIHIVNVADRIVQLHLGGKIEVSNKVPLKTRDDLSSVYTPGVASVALEIAQNPTAVWALTIKRNTVAVVTDGSAVLGLGDIGPLAAMPVMEGKCMLFKEFANVDAWPICLNTKDVDEIVRTVKDISAGFGSINLEDISAPRCFEIEERLKQELDIPVFHDDQHGTAVVVLAALLNSLKIIKKRIEEVKIVICGVGAAGIATAKLLLTAGASNIVGCDRCGIVYKGRSEGMNSAKEWVAEHTNPLNIRGTLADALEGSDVFIGVSGPSLLKVSDLKRMNHEPIVFAMANPVPEIMPEEAAPHARIVATGRSDYPNQINNVLCFPGLFRGVLDVRATTINEEMKLAAAQAIASLVSTRELCEDHIIPSAFNKRVVRAVASAVAKAAHDTQVARRTPRARPLRHL